MNQQKSPENNLPSTPSSGIQQQVENSTLGGGMQAIQGDNNIQLLFENAPPEGNITVKNITHIYKTVNNLGDIPKPTGFPQNIPASNTDKFVGRERELEHLHQQLQCNHSVVIAAVEGMGGVGKTELAIQYSLLHLQLHSYPSGICWLRARESDIGLQIIQFARIDLGLHPPEDLKLPEQVGWCWRHWQQGNTLVVLDDVNNYSQIKPYLPPQTSQFKVLITTRLKLDLAGSLFLEVLSQTDALLLLAQLIGEEKQNQELAQAKEVCQRLGYLPLALQLVGRYVKKRKITLAEMLRRLEAKGLGHPSLVVNENDPTWTLNVKRGVAAAFELSWSELNDDAQQLGYLLSLFALAPIPWSLVERAAVEQDSEELEDARVKLENLHLLQGEETYRLHQLIREFIRNKQNNLAAADEQKSNFCKALVKIAQNIPESPTQELIKSVKYAIPHLEEVVQNFIDVVANEDLISVFVGLGKFYEAQGLYALAEPWIMQSVKAIKVRLGENHPDYLQSLSILAGLYTFQGKYEQAEPLFIQGQELIKRIMGENHPDYATSLNNLAFLYFSQGKYEQAEPLFIKAKELRKRILGENHLDYATSLNSLAELYRWQAKYEQAEPLYIQALELRKRIIGENHPNYATSLNNLALLYYQQEKYEQAEPLFNQVSELTKHIFGEKHPNYALNLKHLASLYESQGKYKQAEPLYIEALELIKDILGEYHPVYLSSLNSLAFFYNGQGNYKQAEPLYIQALKLCERILGKNHPNFVSLCNNLGELYKSQGKYEQAEPLYIQALELCERILGKNHPKYALSLNNLGELYKSQGKYEQAEPLLVQALELRKCILGENHSRYALSLNNLGELYKSQGKYEQAELLLVQALELRKRILGENHSDYALSLNNLAELYQSQGRYDQAKPLYVEALGISELSLGVNHPNTITIRENLKSLGDNHA